MSRERRRPPPGFTDSSPRRPTATSTERTTRGRTPPSSRAGRRTTSTRTTLSQTPGFDVLAVARDEEDSFIASELVHADRGVCGGGVEDGEGDRDGRRVGWWQPKVGEERADDARVWREDLGMVPKEEDDPEDGDVRDPEDEAAVPDGPRDSARDFANAAGDGDGDASDASSTGWITDRTKDGPKRRRTEEDSDSPRPRRTPPPVPSTPCPDGTRILPSSTSSSTR